MSDDELTAVRDVLNDLITTVEVDIALYDMVDMVADDKVVLCFTSPDTRDAKKVLGGLVHHLEVEEKSAIHVAVKQKRAAAVAATTETETTTTPTTTTTTTTDKVRTSSDDDDEMNTAKSSLPAGVIIANDDGGGEGDPNTVEPSRDKFQRWCLVCGDQSTCVVM